MIVMKNKLLNILSMLRIFDVSNFDKSNEYIFMHLSNIFEKEVN